MDAVYCFYVVVSFHMVTGIIYGSFALLWDEWPLVMGDSGVR